MCVWRGRAGGGGGGGGTVRATFGKVPARTFRSSRPFRQAWMCASAVQAESGYDAAAAVAAIDMTTQQEQELLKVQGLAPPIPHHASSFPAHL